MSQAPEEGDAAAKLASSELASSERTAANDQPLRPEDFYMDGPYMVFTESYHLRRGYCCNSSCRHCPYGK
jgi:Family of unknown function (DUF5522)